MHSEPASPELTPPPQKYDGPDEECKSWLCQHGLTRQSIEEILLEYNSVTIGLFNDYTALQALQAVVTNCLKVKDREAVISTHDLGNIKKDFAKKIKDSHATLCEKARREVMGFYGQARRLLPSEKSSHLLAYLRENSEPATASMGVQYELNLEVLPYMVKIIVDLNSELDMLRNVVKKQNTSNRRKQSFSKRCTKNLVNDSRRKRKITDLEDDDAQAVIQPRRSKRIAKRQTRPHKT